MKQIKDLQETRLAIGAVLAVLPFVQAQYFNFTLMFVSAALGLLIIFTNLLAPGNTRDTCILICWLVFGLTLLGL